MISVEFVDTAFAARVISDEANVITDEANVITDGAGVSPQFSALSFQ